LFLTLAAAFAGLAAYAGTDGQWIITVAAAALATFMGDLALRAVR
jgi:hypothetical protein